MQGRLLTGELAVHCVILGAVRKAIWHVAQRRGTSWRVSPWKTCMANDVSCHLSPLAPVHLKLKIHTHPPCAFHSVPHCSQWTTSVHLETPFSTSSSPPPFISNPAPVLSILPAERLSDPLTFLLCHRLPRTGLAIIHSLLASRSVRPAACPLAISHRLTPVLHSAAR